MFPGCPETPQEVGVTYNANAVTRAENVPVTTSECERTVSVLRRLKTYLRSTMRQGRLRSLAILNINYTMVIDDDEVIDMFARKHPRRMILRNIIG